MEKTLQTPSINRILPVDPNYEFEVTFQYDDNQAIKNQAFIMEEDADEGEYLYDGIQMIPEEKKDNYSKEASTIFTLLTNIYQDVVIPHTRRIDYSFLEVMFAEKISFAKKMIYINEYPKMEWKSALNSTFFSNDIF